MKGAALVSPHADPWAAEVVDLESLNAGATRSIVTAVDAVRERARNGEKGASVPFVAVGPAGVGKTHLFGRLRRLLGPKAVLVHVRPVIGGEMTPRFLLGQIVQQLAYESFGYTQIDVAAGVALAHATGQTTRYPRACLEELRALAPDERPRRIEQAVVALAGKHPQLDPDYLERLFEIPFTDGLVRVASLLWLAGRDLGEAQQRRAGVREALPDSAIIPALRTLAVVSSLAAPLVVIFDQLENLVEADGSAGRIVAYGNLVSELVDSVQDVIVVQMGLDSEWNEHIFPKLGQSHRSRVIGINVPLALPDAVQCRGLLELWIKTIPNPEAPFPWPFTQAQLDAICAAPGTTPRMLLLDLRTALEGGEPTGARAPAAKPDEAIAAAWARALEAQRRHLDEMAAMGQGPESAYLLDGFVSLATVAGLGEIKAAKDALAFNGGRIVHVHHANDSSLRASFKKLAPPVFAVRERWREFPPTWKATRAEWEALRARSGVRWHWLDREDAARLLALAALLKDARSSDVEDAGGAPIPPARVEDWLNRELKPREWNVTRALLGEQAPPDESVPARARTAAATAAADVLRALRVASLEHVIRACAGAGRAAVQAELRANPRVKWFGDAIVSWTE